MSDPKRIAYIRTSPADGPGERVQLQLVPVDESFRDELVSQRDHRRPQRRLALGRVQRGDTLVVQSMERLARDGGDLRRVLLDLNQRGAAVEFVTEALTLFPCDREQRERELALIEAGQRFIRASDAERQRVGIAKARTAKRKYNGRPMKLTARQIIELQARLGKLGEGRGDSVAKMAEYFHVSRQTIYTYAKNIGGFLSAASAMSRSKRQRARGEAENAEKTKASATVKRRSANQAAKGVSFASVKEALKANDPGEPEAQ